MKKAIITGTSGFVGKNLINDLHNNLSLQLISISRNPDYEKQSDSLDEVISYDEYFACNLNASYYIHLAGKAHDLKNMSDDTEYFTVNYELTKKLYDRFVADKSASDFIYISSVKAIADQVNGELDEEYDPTPVTAYGRSKLKAEEYILDNLIEGKQVFILRPCMIHGPGNKGNLNLLFKIVQKGIPWPLGNYNNKRSFLSIDNFCYVIREILNNNISQCVYNLADDEPLSTNQVVEMISEQLGRKPKILNIPKPLIQFGAKLGNKLPLPLNEERLQKLTENYLVSNKKIVSEIGKPLPVSAREGMRKTIQSLIEENG
jgi:nucleoside-diphosphate-sugar epimerase